MYKIGLILIVLTSFGKQLNAQQNGKTYAAEYYRLISVSRDSTSRFCEQLIASDSPGKMAFGYAGKAHLATLNSNFELADDWFEKADLALRTFESDQTLELKGHILLLKALRLIESHELEEAINLLSEVSNFCNEDCSFLLTNKVQSALGRSYSLSSQHFNALQISHVSLKPFVLN